MMSVSKPHTLSALFFLLIFLSFKLSYCIVNGSIVVCPEIEKQSLLSFKQSLHDPLNMLSSWNGEVNCCEWERVSCSNLTGHVHQLHLQSDDYESFLSGKINPCLLNLKHLKYLDLSQNDFEETIPSFIGSLTSLEYLDLSGAGFHGMIPHNIGNLSNLHTLIISSLERNLYSKSVQYGDSLEWLSGLSKLEHLNMNYVDLSKAADKWPEQVINKLPSLVELHFSYCSLGSNIGAPLNDIVVNITHSNLAVLDLSSNSFEGPIPNFRNITKLQHLDLSWNKLNSSIPEWLYSCTHLQFVNLKLNNIEGTISSSIANLTSLITLDLSYNQLSGNIPKEIGNLCKMKVLDLSSNKLKGEISDLIGNMSDCFLGALETLILFGNQLEGVIPNSIGNLSSLQILALDSNKLSGNLPESVGKLFNLEGLGISGNMLEGVVTETHFSHLSKLTTLSASRNHLTLKVSPNWIPPFKLDDLRLASWNLGSGSQIPSWLHTQKKNISLLDLSCTGISGNVPSWIWSMSYLNLSHNQLQGKIPDLSGRPDFGQLVYLSSNNFSGSLPRVGNNVIELDLSDNSFSGGISRFLCHTTTNETYTNYLEILHLGGNKLSGELPDDCSMKWTSLTVLNLGNNNFSGRIPNSIGLLPNLRSLNLYGNKFSGRIPSSIQNCTQLLKMDLSDNNLDGSIPAWIGTSLSNLEFLILRSNKLSGEITPSICKLTSLQILDLSDNKFSGAIPKCVNNFIAMATKRSLPEYGYGRLGYSRYFGAFRESASIAIKGSELHYDTILPLVNSIDLSNNNLSGNIQKEITSLLELKSLNLSGNHFTGLIPDGIGNMTQLESLDFSRNSLSGEIPSSFASISSLSYLNLSCNNLTGRIPIGTQLQLLNESSFIGNNLCGPPLTISCSNDGKALAPAHAEDQDQEDDKPEIEWLYVFGSLGYAVGLSGVLFTFYVKKSWMEACYELLEDMWDTVYVYFYIRWRRLKRSFCPN